MPKAIITLGYKNYVVNLEQAMTIADAITNAEQYDTKYVDSSRSHYIYNDTESPEVTVRVVPDEFYRMAKLAGKPTK